MVEVMEWLSDEVRLRRLGLFCLVRKRLTGYDWGLQNHAGRGSAEDRSFSKGRITKGSLNTTIPEASSCSETHRRLVQNKLNDVLLYTAGSDLLKRAATEAVETENISRLKKRLDTFLDKRFTDGN